jgi:hypothetical protein
LCLPVVVVKTLELEHFVAGLRAQQIRFFASRRAGRVSGFVLRLLRLGLTATDHGVTH